MMQSEVQLFYIIFSGLLFLLPFAVYLSTSEMHDTQVYLWCLGYLGIAIGNLFVGLRGQVPGVLSFEFAQVTMVFGSLLRALSLRMEFVQEKSQLFKQAKLYFFPLTLYVVVFTLLVRLKNFGFVQLRISKLTKKEQLTRLELNETNAEKDRVTELLHEKEILIASLLKANKTATTGALSASLAHELNQPLGASNINIQFLRMKLGKNELNPEVEAEMLATLQSDNERASNIIQSLRSIFLEGKSGSEMSDMNALIKTILVIVQPELKAHNILLTLDLCEQKFIAINRGEIQQVLLNLLNNAIQALTSTGRSGRAITLKTSSDTKFFRLSVADNGAGVPVHLREDLFELLNSTKKNGMGLGLWLCQQIMARHGGLLWHEDTKGGGATFVMELPAS